MYTNLLCHSPILYFYILSICNSITLQCMKSSMAESDHGEVWPTYGELISMLKISMTKAETSNSSVAELLATEFQHKFPQIPINRPSRFLDTVRRLEAPTMPSALGGKKLDGSPLRSYLKRRWIPRIRNTHRQQGMHTCMP